MICLLWLENLSQSELLVVWTPFTLVNLLYLVGVSTQQFIDYIFKVRVQSGVDRGLKGCLLYQSSFTISCQPRL